MKRGIVLVCLVLFLFAFTISLASAQPQFVDIISSDWFNAGLLFALVFVICFVVLKQVFHSNIGVAVVISVILGVAGSFSVIARYGTIFGNFDWVILALVVFIVAAFLASLSKDKEASLTMFMFAVPVAWWAWGRGFFCAPRGTLSLNTCIIVDVVAGILIVIAIIKFLRALVAKRKEYGPFGGAFTRGKTEYWEYAGHRDLDRKTTFMQREASFRKLKGERTPRAIKLDGENERMSREKTYRGLKGEFDELNRVRAIREQNAQQEKQLKAQKKQLDAEIKKANADLKKRMAAAGG